MNVTPQTLLLPAFQGQPETAWSLTDLNTHSLKRITTALKADQTAEQQRTSKVENQTLFHNGHMQIKSL